MRLIDADALKDALDGVRVSSPNEIITQQAVVTLLAQMLIECIDNAPTIEPIEDIKSCGVSEEEQNTLPSAEPSGDLVSREDAIKAVEQEYKIDKGYMADDYTYGFNQAIQYVSDIILHDLPSADTMSIEEHQTIVTELKRSAVRPKGKWINREDSADVFFLYKYECSVCGGKAVLNSTYCPNCGAEMNGE